MFCHVCGAVLPSQAHFCPGCGRSLVTGSPVVPPKAEDLPPEDLDFLLYETEEAPDEPSPTLDATFDPLPPQDVPSESQVKRPSFLPRLILVGMSLVGLVCYFLFPLPSADPSHSNLPSQSQPSQNAPDDFASSQIPENSPTIRSDFFTPAPEHCFSMTEDGLVFLPEKYDSGPVLVIPNAIDGVPVTTIAPRGFAQMEGVTTLILPDCLSEIGSEAFADCAQLRGVYFPQSLTHIGEKAFSHCLLLEAVSFGSGMEAIDSGAFSGCASLRYIFYNGTFEQWVELYHEYITPFTYVSCLDGEYYHGVPHS